VLIVPIGTNDVLRITYVDLDGENLPEPEIIYQVEKIGIGVGSAVIYLSEEPLGDVHLKIGSEKSGGIVLTERKSGSIFGDYEFLNSTTIRIIDPDVVNFFSDPSHNPYIVISYIRYPDMLGGLTGDTGLTGSTGDFDLELRSEFNRFVGINTSKIYKKLVNGDELYIYRLNYQIPDTINLKIMIDGITLKPYAEGMGPDDWDYKIDSLDEYNNIDNYEVILNTTTLTLGSVLGAYYLIGEGVLNVIVPGFREDITYVEYLTSVESNYIDASTRKIITDHSSGWYPLLFKYYVDYIKRGELGEQSPLQSNAFNFNEVFKFLKRKGMAISIFMDFVKQLLPATAIIRREGVVIKNSVYTRQKFTYKRGVSFNEDLNWMGDNGSEFKQEYIIETSNWLDGFSLSHYDVESDSGYLGPVYDMFNSSDITEKVFGDVDVPGNDLGIFDNIWLGFYYGGKYLFIAKKPLRNNISWNDIYNKGAVFGSGDYGPYNSGIDIIQNKIVEIDNPFSLYYNNLFFRVRLMTGGDSNPYLNFGGEWNSLMPNLINGVWDNYSLFDIGISSMGNYAGSWCQETDKNEDYPNKRLIRGIEYVDDGYSLSKNVEGLIGVWRPVLELIAPWE
jgi:hypothetical protein